MKSIFAIVLTCLTLTAQQGYCQKNGIDKEEFFKNETLLKVTIERKIISQKQRSLAAEMQHILDQSNYQMYRMRQIEREVQELARQEIDLTVHARIRHLKMVRR